MEIESAETPNLATVAHEYYITGLPQSDIAEKWKMKQSTVSNWLQQARDRGVVFFDIDPDFADSGTEYREKSTKLRDHFGLWEAFVVDVRNDSLYDDQKGDDLHSIVANTVVTVRLRNWIQSGNHVVIGGGRAPIKFARTIRRTSPSSRDVRISPISGRIWTGSWQEDGPDPLERPLDSDDAARLLAYAYEREPGTRFSQVGLPLYPATRLGQVGLTVNREQEEQEKALVRKTIEEECVFIPGGNWNTTWGLQPPAKALVGVGVLHLDSGHRIAQLVKKIQSNPGYKVAPRLEWAASRFKSAMNFTKRNGLPYFGDVANRLFPALFLPAELKARQTEMATVDEHYGELSAMLGELNTRAVVMEWEHLRGIESVWAIAAGDLKINVLFTLLLERRLLAGERNKSIIKALATDARTSDRLLEALREYERAPAEHQNWYSNMVRKIFV